MSVKTWVVGLSTVIFLLSSASAANAFCRNIKYGDANLWPGYAKCCDLQDGRSVSRRRNNPEDERVDPRSCQQRIQGMTKRQAEKLRMRKDIDRQWKERKAKKCRKRCVQTTNASTAWLQLKEFLSAARPICPGRLSKYPTAASLFSRWDMKVCLRDPGRMGVTKCTIGAILSTLRKTGQTHITNACFQTITRLVHHRNTVVRQLKNCAANCNK
jgi:hypothetical protein